MNGDYYEGEWQDDAFHGKGRQVLKDGTVYDGKWYNDEKHGEGVLKSKSGYWRQVYQNGLLIKQEIYHEKK